MLVDLVAVAAGGVGLPDLDQRVADGRPSASSTRPRDDDALAQRLALVLAREVVVELADGVVARTPGRSAPTASAAAAAAVAAARAGACRRSRAEVGGIGVARRALVVRCAAVARLAHSAPSSSVAS